MTLLFASGDSGVGCDNSCAVFVPNWPASSPYVTSVGGVMLDSTSPFQVEGDSISSGGFSNVFSTPTYQVRAYIQLLLVFLLLIAFFNTDPSRSKLLEDSSFKPPSCYFLQRDWSCHARYCRLLRERSSFGWWWLESCR